jgi:hypothetical protein
MEFPKHGLWPIFMIRHWCSFWPSTFDSHFLMNKIGYLTVTMDVIALRKCTCTGNVLNGVWFRSAFSIHIVRRVRNLQNTHILVVSANDFTLDGYHKSSCFLDDFARISTLFYRHLVSEVHRRVSGVGVCSSILLFFLVSFWCFHFVVAEDHVS